MADVAKTHLAVHLGIATTRDVEDVARLGLFLDLHLHGAANLPERLTIDEGLYGCLPPTLAANSLACSIEELRTASAMVFCATSMPWLALSVS